MTYFASRSLIAAVTFTLALVPAMAQEAAKAPADAAACNAAAKAWFGKAHPKPTKTVLKDHARLASFKTRFGATSRRCYVLEDVAVKKPDGSVAREGRKLFTIEVGPAQQLGRYIGPEAPTVCEFGGKPCAGKAEWQKLAEAQMSN